MARVQFAIRLSGSGDSIEDAWRDACEGFALDSGPTPDLTDTDVYCDGCDHEVAGYSKNSQNWRADALPVRSKEGQ